jgi:hypothetical protein
MKNILLFIGLWGICYLANSQTQRLVLLEEFTSATCSPCVSANARFHSWQIQNPGAFASLYYHVNWPSAGDPMNLANPGEVSTRVSLNMSPSNSYVPYSVLDGNYYNGDADGWNMTDISDRTSLSSPFNIQVQHRVSQAHDTVFSNMLITCTQNVAASMAAHNVILEKWIHFSSAPCSYSNGERDFYNVMKKMMPGANGTTMPLSMVPGDYILLEGVWKPGLVYDFTQIASLGFVQDKNTKEIYQAANSTLNPLVLPYDNDLQVLDVENITSKTCKNHLSPAIRIRNNGNNPVTNLTVKYKINDGVLSSYSWNGSLESLQKAVVVLPEYVFELLPQNTLTVYTTNPNNISDQYPKNDTLVFRFTTSAASSSQIKVAIRTDKSPAETSWTIKNSLNVVVANGGPYTLPNKLYQQTVTLPQADCYSFTINDTGGDGICCSNGNGGYEVSSNGAIIKQGGSFGFNEMSEFIMDAPVDVAEIQVTKPFSVFPNPFDSHAKIVFQVNKSSEVHMNLYNTVGQLINARSLGTLGAGRHETVIEGQNLKSGVYILKMNTGSEVYSGKITVVR